jgi:hypothetical protein
MVAVQFVEQRDEVLEVPAEPIDPPARRPAGASRQPEVDQGPVVDPSHR